MNSSSSKKSKHQTNKFYKKNPLEEKKKRGTKGMFFQI